MTLVKKIDTKDALYQEARDLRYELFFKAHGLPTSILDDEKEAQSTHVAIVEDGLLVGYGRLSEVEMKVFQISQMVVAPRHQSKGYGTILLKDLIQLALNSGAASIILNARITATGLYEKQGFATQGEVFNSTSTGIPHIKMVYESGNSG